MKVQISLYTNHHREDICVLDTKDFTYEQVRKSMVRHAFPEENVIVSGFVDWKMKRFLQVEWAYILDKVITELYDGDDFIVKTLLEKGFSPSEICRSYYTFCGNTKEEVLKSVLLTLDKEEIISYTLGRSLDELVNQAIIDKILVGTPKGFLLRKLTA